MSRENREPVRLLERWNQGERLEGPLITEATRLSDLLVTHRDKLSSGALGNEKTLETPVVEFWHDNGPAIAGFFKAKKGGRLKNRPISCFMQEDPHSNGVIYKFNLDPASGLTTMVETGENFTNLSLFKKAVDSLEKKFDELEQQKKLRRRRYGKLMVTGLAVVTAVTSLAEGIDRLQERSDRLERRAVAVRKAFDERDYQIPGAGSLLSTVEVGNIDPEQFSSIPSYKKGDHLFKARRFKLDENTCKKFSRLVTGDEQVVIVTSKTDNIHNQPLLAGRGEDGNLEVCSTDGYPSEYISWSLAIQVKE